MDRKLRRQRLREYSQASGTKRGLVSVGMAAWILDVCRQRVYALVISGQLVQRRFGGQCMIFAPSIYRFFLSGQGREQRKKRARIRGLKGLKGIAEGKQQQLSRCP
jgi:hypothetical protein